jgi:cell division protein FtsL
MKSWLLLLGLLAAVVISAISLIALKHQGRQLFIELEQESREYDRHQVDWSRLQIELAWLGESGRIEQQAGAQLGMNAPARIGVLVADDD